MCVLASGYVEMNYLMLQILFCFYLFLLKLDTCSFSAAALTFVLLESRLEERIFFCTLCFSEGVTANKRNATADMASDIFTLQSLCFRRKGSVFL